MWFLCVVGDGCLLSLFCLVFVCRVVVVVCCCLGFVDCVGVDC